MGSFCTNAGFSPTMGSKFVVFNILMVIMDPKMHIYGHLRLEDKYCNHLTNNIFQYLKSTLDNIVDEY